MKLNFAQDKIYGRLFTTLLIVLAFVFCLAVKLTWTDHFKENNDFKWNNEFMVVTNDSYYFAEGARDLAFCQKDNVSLGEYYQKNCHQENDLSPVNEPLSKITYWLYKILPLQFETLIFYMPAVIGLFIIIPIILLSRGLNITTVGLMAAIFTGIGCSYYNRTMVGYYDTDMLTLTMPFIIFSTLAMSVYSRKNIYILLSGIAITMYQWWYPQAYSINMAFIVVLAIYSFIDIYFFKADKTFYFKLFIVTLLSTSLLGLIESLIIVFISYYIAISTKNEKSIFYVFITSLIIFGIFFAFNGADQVWIRLKLYVFRDSVFLLNDEVNLHFFSVMQTIVESGGNAGAPFDAQFREFSQRITIYPILTIVAAIGYIWLCIKKPVFILMLPIIAVGLLSFSKGIRFSMYMIPAAGFGLAFVIVKISEIIKSFLLNKKTGNLIYTVMVTLLFAIIIYPQIRHAYEYKAGTVFVKPEVELLDKLKNNISKEDYIISWWDYGYPLRYYADSKTLIDGAKHEGAENFPVSFILGSDQQSAANMARLDVEYTEKRFAIGQENRALPKNNTIKIPSNNIAWIMKDYNFTNSNDFLLSLQTDINLPEKTRDIYLYLPFRMLDIFPTILRFSNRNLMTGEEYRDSFFLPSRRFSQTGNILQLEQGFSIDLQQGTLITPKKENVRLKRFVTTGINQDGHYKNIQMIDPDSRFTLMHLQSYNIMLLIDEKMYNSAYIQMFYLENYDKNLFELIDSNPYAKVYKLKI